MAIMEQGNTELYTSVPAGWDASLPDPEEFLVAGSGHYAECNHTFLDFAEAWRSRLTAGQSLILESLIRPTFDIYLASPIKGWISRFPPPYDDAADLQALVDIGLVDYADEIPEIACDTPVRKQRRQERVELSTTPNNLPRWRVNREKLISIRGESGTDGTHVETNEPATIERHNPERRPRNTYPGVRRVGRSNTPKALVKA